MEPTTIATAIVTLFASEAVKARGKSFGEGTSKLVNQVITAVRNKFKTNENSTAYRLRVTLYSWDSRSMIGEFYINAGETWSSDYLKPGNYKSIAESLAPNVIPKKKKFSLTEGEKEGIELLIK